MHYFQAHKFVIALILWVSSTEPVKAADYDVYVLAGQSNMEGFGYTKDLPSELLEPVGGVFIFHGSSGGDGKQLNGQGIWEVLKPGHGRGFKSDGKTNQLTDRFGAELTFARRMKELYPTKKIALIKYARGGTSISAKASAAARSGCWEPDFKRSDDANGSVNQYDHFLATIQNAYATHDIDGDGENDSLHPAGILWMQGESDAEEEGIAKEYEDNLTRLVSLFRAALRKDDVPVVLGRISDSGNDSKDAEKANGKVWDFGDLVRQAQANFVANDVNARLVTSTDQYGYSDPYHYDSAGYIDLGIQFADALSPDVTRDKLAE